MAPVIASPRPQFSVEVCNLPPRTGPRTPAERRPEPTRRTARHDSRQSIGNDESVAINTGIHTTSSSPASRSRTASLGIPPRTEQTPSNDPPDHEPGATDRLDGREEPEPTHRVPMTHRAVRPSKTPPRRRAGFTPEEHPTPARRSPDGRPAKLPTDIGRRENSTSHAIEEPSQRPGSGPRRRRTTKSLIDDHQTIRPAPQTARTVSSGHTSTTRGAPPEGVRNTHDEPPAERTSSRTFVRRRDDRNRGDPHHMTEHAEHPNDLDRARSLDGASAAGIVPTADGAAEHADTTRSHHPEAAPSGTRSTHDEPRSGHPLINDEPKSDAAAELVGVEPETIRLLADAADDAASPLGIRLARALARVRQQRT